MSEPPRVTVTTPTDEQSVRVHDEVATVELEDAAFSFSINAGSRDDQDRRDRTESEDHEPRHIAPVDAVPVEDTLRCEARKERRGVEFLLHREGEEIVAWRNSCPHQPDVPLDPGSGAIVTDEHLVCHKHGARFERGEGTCTAGPCAGDALDEIDVTVEDGAVWLADDRFDEARRLE